MSWTDTFPFEPASVPMARRRLTVELRARKIDPERIDDAVLVLSELVGNALRHARPLAGGELQVSWTLYPRELELAVTDGGAPTRPRALHPPVSALGGRGLSIVGDLSRDWGVRSHEDGHGQEGPTPTTVYAILPLRD